MMKLVTEEQQAGGLMMSLPVFLWKSLPKSGKSAERVEKPGVPLSQLLQGPRKELFLLIHLLR